MIMRCNEYRRAYADVLYRWGLLTQRSEVVKYQSVNDLNRENSEQNYEYQLLLLKLSVCL